MLWDEGVDHHAVQMTGGQSWKKQGARYVNAGKTFMIENLSVLFASGDFTFAHDLPGLSNLATTGPMVREAQRHLAQWALQPVAVMIGQEASDKLGGAIKLDVMRPLQAFDAGGRARALGAIVQTLALAKEAGVDPSEALKLVDWDRS